VEQLVARWAHNPKVTGSSPVPATKAFRNESLFYFAYQLVSPNQKRYPQLSVALWYI
jgi:hypothetical protein